MRGDCPLCPAEEAAKGALMGAAEGPVFELDKTRVIIVRIFIWFRVVPTTAPHPTAGKLGRWGYTARLGSSPGCPLDYSLLPLGTVRAGAR
jgi:hypothetical protein